MSKTRLFNISKQNFKMSFTCQQIIPQNVRISKKALEILEYIVVSCNVPYQIISKIEFSRTVSHNL